MATTSILRLRPVPLTRGLFAPFGEVIETDGNPHCTINDGYAEACHSTSDESWSRSSITT